MTFSASSGELWLAAAGAGLAAVALGALEWRRPDRRHRAWRICAAAMAVAALALLGLHPAWLQVRGSAKAGGVVAGLWTAGAAGDNAGIPARYRIALPGATAAPAGATVFPDSGTLRRRFPEITGVEVFGDGLEAGDLEALRGLRVVFQQSALDRLPAPSIRFVHYPRTLPLGEPLVIEGKVAGLTPGTHPALTLEAPDGSMVEVGATATVDAEGKASFTLRAAPPSAVGRFTWRLRLQPPGKPSDPAVETESLGIAVLKPTLPRLLVLESSPHFDTADLRRWFARAGGQLNVRTMVGQDRFCFASSGAEPAPEFPVVDARLLEGVDLVLADPAALAALTPVERAALLAAVADTGLGILALADEMPAPAAASLSLFPWQLTAAPETEPDGGEHLERPGWVGQSKPIATPVPAAPVVLAPQSGQSALIQDGQGRVLAAALPRGRGEIALTLLHDSGRWLRGNDFAAFAEYWSFLFSRLARPLNGVSGPGVWALGESAPIFAGQPLTLLWSGPAPAQATAQVTAASGLQEDNATLALARDAAEPSQWRGTFWPRRAGWYRVSTVGGSSLDFFVDSAGSWAGVAGERRQWATARLAQESGGAQPVVLSPTAKGDTAVPAVCCFLFFLTGAGFLWTERRLAGS